MEFGIFFQMKVIMFCDLVPIYRIQFINLLLKIITISDIMRFSDSFSQTKSVAKSRVHCFFRPRAAAGSLLNL